jgi:membrane-associated protease RseP (regulator of RpoE activity)
MRALTRSLAAGTFLLALSFTASAVPPEKNSGRKPAEKAIVVPFELLKSRHMAVEVKINGTGPYRLIFDTGAPTNLLNNKVATESGLLKKTDKPSGFGGFFGIAGAKTIDELQIGDVKMAKVPVMVMDHPTVEAISKALGPIDGLVGFPFFARYKTTIDYEKKELTFEPNGYEPGDAMQALMTKVMGAQGKQEPTIVAPKGLWGFSADKENDDEEAGVTVKDVLEGSPAATGGLKSGDRLLTIDGRWTDSLADTLTATSLVRVGREVTVVVKRDGKEVSLKVKPTKGT